MAVASVAAACRSSRLGMRALCPTWRRSRRHERTWARQWLDSCKVAWPTTSFTWLAGSSDRIVPVPTRVSGRMRDAHLLTGRKKWQCGVAKTSARASIHASSYSGQSAPALEGLQLRRMASGDVGAVLPRHYAHDVVVASSCALQTDQQLRTEHLLAMDAIFLAMSLVVRCQLWCSLPSLPSSCIRWI